MRCCLGKDKDKKTGKTVVNQELLDKITSQLAVENWRTRKAAKSLLETSPLAYQLKGLGSLPGQRRGTKSVENAREPFRTLNQFISSRGEGSDQPINKSLATALQEILGLKPSEISAEKFHP